MIYAAQGAEQHGMLEQLITAAYPTAIIKRTLNTLLKVIKNDRLQRCMLREVEGIPESKIRTCTLSEPLNQLAVQFPQFGFHGSRKPQLDALAFRIYQRTAARYIRHSCAKLYHCRSGYGGKTITLARKKGMMILVDHSIAHPRALMQLMNGGTYDFTKREPLPAMWRLVQDDIEDADYILVNSDFVKKTMVDYGYSHDRVIVQYLGIDSEIEGYLRNQRRTRTGNDPEIKFLFAGGVGRRKGVDLLLDVIEKLPQQGWSLTLAGGIELELKERINTLRHPKVKVLGPVFREELIRLMLDHDVFVFPTLAEGSARVIFESMAAGMAVITTPNAGSVIEHEKHGYIISPGSPESLYDAMIRCFENRERLSEYGSSARGLVQDRYHSGIYRDAVVDIYSTLLTNNN
jgi:glycosyltransferase involved in cell wall biosynthesis